MVSSQQTLVFCASRRALIKLSATYGFVTISLCAFSLITFSMLIMHDTKSMVVTSIWFTMFLIGTLWAFQSTVQSIRRIVRPDRLIISLTGISIAYMGKASKYLWNDLANPEKKLIRQKAGSWVKIRIPVLGKSQPVNIDASIYTNGYEPIFAALLAAKSGTLEYSWAADPTLKRPEETPTDKLVGKIALASCITLCVVMFLKLRIF